MTKPVLTVQHYMSPVVHTIGPKATLGQAHELMRAHGVRHLPVMDGGALVGLVTLHDLHLLETLPDVDQTEVPVEDAMTESPYVVAPDEPLRDVAAVMAESRYSSALVADGDEVLGMFTSIDALRALSDLLADGT